MDTNQRKPWNYRAVRRDLLDEIIKQFSPASTNAALAAAVEAAKLLTDEQRLALARAAEDKARQHRSDIARARFAARPGSHVA